MKVEFVGEVAKLDIRPGDRYILQTDEDLTPVQCAVIQRSWRGFTGGLWAPLLIVPRGAKLSVVRKDEQAA